MSTLKSRFIRCIPNAMTFSALVLGLTSIFSVMFIDHAYVLPFASLCVIVAGIIDGFDGYVARRLNAQSSFGSFLDSFSDLISFGVAPILIIWQTGVLDKYPLSSLPLMLYIFCSVFRLARFHKLAHKDHFVGLPITISGVIIACVAYLYAFTHSKGFFPFPLVVFSGLTLVLAVLMVAPFRFPRLGNRE